MGSVACTAICFQLSATGALYLFLLSKKKEKGTARFFFLYYLMDVLFGFGWAEHRMKSSLA